MGPLILWSKTFYTTIGQYPTLYNYLAIMREDIVCWEYHLDNHNTSVNPKVFRSTLILPPVYSGGGGGGGVSHHMHDSLETYDSPVCHTTKMTCPSICQSCQLSDHHTINANSLCVCQPHESPVCHTTMTTCPSVCQFCLSIIPS